MQRRDVYQRLVPGEYSDALVGVFRSLPIVIARKMLDGDFNMVVKSGGVIPDNQRILIKWALSTLLKTEFARKHLTEGALSMRFFVESCGLGVSTVLAEHDTWAPWV